MQMYLCKIRGYMMNFFKKCLYLMNKLKTQGYLLKDSFSIFKWWITYGVLVLVEYISPRSDFF